MMLRGIVKLFFFGVILTAIPLSVDAADAPYDSQYCKDPMELQNWERIKWDWLVVAAHSPTVDRTSHSDWRRVG